MLRENIFLTLGSPLIDIIVEVDESFLIKYGLKSNDAIKASDNCKHLFHDIEKFGTVFKAGGCALNTARALQHTLKLSQSCMVLGAIGKDSYSEILKSQLNKEHVSFIFEEISGYETGKCAVLTNGKNRSLYTDLGASEYFNLQHLKSNKFWKSIESAKYYYIPAFFLSVSYECIMKIARHSHEQQKLFCFNLSAPFIANKYEKELKDLVPYIDIIFGNESEVRAYAKVNNITLDNFHKILLYINNLPKMKSNHKRLTIITRGPNPVCIVQDNKVTEFEVNKFECDIIDTNGAGDAFVGGFMAEYIRGSSIENCVATAIIIASQTLMNIGCSFE